LGNSFLKLFLDFINLSEKLENFNTEDYTVTVEKYVGFIDKEAQTGGKIDIFLEDKNGNSISIENKIDAGEQSEQIKRYHSHNEEKNTVLYLTLHGNAATEFSACELKANEDYHCLSYQNHIIDWLELCLKEATDHPILRESIKQYLILVKKLTNTLEMEGEKELENLVWDYIEGSMYIKDSFDVILKKQRSKVRDAVMKKLIESLPNYDVHTDVDTDFNYSPINLSPVVLNKGKGLWFGIESFGTGGLLDGNLFVGIKDYGNTNPDAIFNGQEDLNTHNWKSYKIIKHDNEPILFKDIHFVKKTRNEEFLNKLVDTIVKESREFINEHEHQLKKLNDK